MKMAMRSLLLFLASTAVTGNWAQSSEFLYRDDRSSLSVQNGAREQQGPRRSYALNREQYEVILTRLDGLVRNNDRLGLIKVGDELEGKWGVVAGDHYGRAMLELANLLANNFRDYQSSEKYALQALAHARTFSLRLETQLLGFIKRDLALTTPAWRNERQTKAKLWLHAWGQLERNIKRNFDFSDRPLLNLRPPPETGLPAGVAPEAIEDAKLRATYEAALAANARKAAEYNRQFELRYLDGMFPKRAEEYLVRVYSKPPSDIQELRRYLISYGISKQIRERMLASVTQNASPARR